MASKTIPLRIESVANLREHWRKRWKRGKSHHDACFLLTRTMMPARLPCVVTLTRIAPRKLDSHDNLASGCKAAVDGIAAALGVKDNDPRVEWRYAQERGAAKEYALRIEIEQC